MTNQLLAVAVLLAIGLLWTLVNIKTSKASSFKTVSLAMAVLFLVSGSAAGAWVALGLLS